MEDLNTQIGQRIVQIRRSNHLTQYQFSEIMDISVKHCSAVERGKSSLSMEKLVKLCDTFDVSMDYLTRGIDHYHNLENINPNIISEIEKYNDENSQSLLLEYLKMFKKISGKNE